MSDAAQDAPAAAAGTLGGVPLALSWALRALHTRGGQWVASALYVALATLMAGIDTWPVVAVGAAVTFLCMISERHSHCKPIHPPPPPPPSTCSLPACHTSFVTPQVCHAPSLARANFATRQFCHIPNLSRAPDSRKCHTR